jgi:hypothetical protein
LSAAPARDVSAGKEATMLTVDEVIRILNEVALGAPPSIPGDEAQRMRDRLAVEVAEMKAKGIPIEVPWEYPDADTPTLEEDRAEFDKNVRDAKSK